MRIEPLKRSLFPCLLFIFFTSTILYASAYGASSRENRDSTRIAASTHYWKGALHRLFLGSDYRKLWTLPIDVEILDLHGTAGGLSPVMRVGGQQTKGLALKGADGRAFTFRGIDKDPSSVLPPMLEGTIADRVVQDQMSSAQPAGPLVAEILMKAAGILNTPIRFVVMPDDPVLEEFQEDFAGVLGTFQEFPTEASRINPGFSGVQEIVDCHELWKRIGASPNERIDTRAFLKARLLDILIGDWDRHRKQWRWAFFPDKPKWQPIPEDRDQAFCKYDGLMLDIARFSRPFFLKFSDRYPSINALTFGSWAVDHFILTDMARAEWTDVAGELQTRLTDSVIEEAARRLPPEYFAHEGAKLEADLKKRRDGLVEIADQFYSHMARWVDIHLTDSPELVEIQKVNAGTAEVRVFLKAVETDKSKQEPYYKRRFHRSETKEIRVYCMGGEDSIINRGTSRGGIRFLVIGGQGRDHFDDTQGGRLKIYDSADDNEILRGKATRYNSKHYDPPRVSENDPWVKPQDWGHQTIPSIWFGGGPDLGMFIGGGFTHKTYRFRKFPYSSSQTFRAGYATSPQTFRADYRGEFYFENSASLFSLSARASGIEILHFYGFGNETTLTESEDYYKVRQEQYSIDPVLLLSVSDAMTFTAGPTLKVSTTRQEQQCIIDDLNPYGSDRFSQAGIRTKLALMSGFNPSKESLGVHLTLEGLYFPNWLDVEKPFGSVAGFIAASLPFRSIPLHPLLALRSGFKHVFGKYPFHEAAFLGGGGLTGSDATVRGLQSQRFAGDGRIYCNAELRLRLSDFYVLLPGEMGLFGLADVGRVYLDGEASQKWHAGYGGGLWLSFLDNAFTLTLSFAQAEERLGFYVQSGFLF